jgi:acyl carrier protein
MSKENENLNKAENSALNIADVRQRCLSVINTIAPDTEIDEQVKGWLDDLDFVEIVMEAELQFDCTIKEGETRIDDFEKVSDLVDWLASNVA